MKIKAKKAFGAKHRLTADGETHETLLEHYQRRLAEVESAIQFAEEALLRPQSKEEYDALVFALKYFVEELSSNDEYAERVRSIEAMLARAGIKI